MTKIAFVVIASKEEPWHSIQKKGQEETWIKTLSNDERAVFAYSDGTLGKSWISPSNHREICFEPGLEQNHVLSEPKKIGPMHFEFQSVSGYGSLVSTSLSAIKFVLDSSNPDFIIRTNVSSYWNLPTLRTFLTSDGEKLEYGGVPGLLGNRITNFISKKYYASGAGIILSNNTARRFLSNLDLIRTDLVDDLALGDLSCRLNIPLTPLNRFDITDVDVVRNCNPELLNSYFHYRCKSVEESESQNRGDLEIMKVLFDTLHRDS